MTASSIPPGKPGAISIQNLDGVTVGFVDADDKQVRTSTTVERTDGDAIPAVEADKKARINTVWGVAAASEGLDRQEQAEAANAETAYVVDDDYSVTKVGGVVDAR